MNEWMYFIFVWSTEDNRKTKTKRWAVRIESVKARLELCYGNLPSPHFLLHQPSQPIDPVTFLLGWCYMSCRGRVRSANSKVSSPGRLGYDARQNTTNPPIPQTQRGRYGPVACRLYAVWCDLFTYYQYRLLNILPEMEIEICVYRLKFI